ncbi:MAG: phosphoglucosamine mutase [Spirochaetes bacterium]|nr:MAG: phosphoglucosamine mutase [Spirochaetota bacterium]
MGTLMKSVSGIRGVVGDTLTPELILKVGAAFARYCKGGHIVVGRDARPTGEAIAHSLESALMLAGCDVTDIGIVPTPTVQLMVEETGARGGVVISASHNPIEWNAFKLIGNSGSFLNAREIGKLFSMMEEPASWRRWDGTGSLARYDGAEDLHIDRVLSVVNAAKIRKKKFRVALDSVNGAGSRITQRLLEKLGCTVVPLYCAIDGTFPRGAEPIPENLKALAAKVGASGADIGFAQDPDADRLAIVDETGAPIGEEYTIALVAEHMLSKRKGRVVVNLSTTRAVEDVAARHGAPFARSRVGEINVVEEMRRGGALIGGEGNGGVISPEVHLGRDSLAGIVYVLEMMAERGGTVSDIVASLPRYVMKKGKIKCDPLKSAGIMERARGEFSREKISRLDGLRIDFRAHAEFKGGWAHLRSSNTEPMFRIITEGRDKAHADAIYRYFAGMFK